MTNTCTATTKSGRPCRALPINWPYALAAKLAGRLQGDGKQ